MWQHLQLARRLRPAYRPGLSLLDVGCAGGHLRHILWSEGLRYRYLGVDIEEAYLRVAREVRDPPGKFVLGDVRDLPRFLRVRFDAVVAYMLIEHLPDERAALESLAMVCQGHLYLRLLLSDQRHEIRKYEDPEDPNSFVYYNILAEDEFRALLGRLGFRRVEIEEDDFVDHLPTERAGPNSTWVHHGLQIIGSIVLPWRHVTATR